jgi:A/G-specific adenine glycosylase
MLVVVGPDGDVYLERRPERGIWGGLWCLPEFDSETAARSFAGNQFSRVRVQPRTLGAIRHAFTHFDLEILPILVECEGYENGRVMEDGQTLWYNPGADDEGRQRIGLPAPVKALLETLSRGIR